MILISHVVTMMLMQSGSAFDRADALLRDSKGLQSDVRITIERVGTGTGRFLFRKPNLQRFLINTKSSSEELFQNEKATVLLARSAKEYAWYPPNQDIMEAPPEAGMFTHYGLPGLLTRGGLSQVAKKESWRPAGKEKIGSIETEIIGMVQKGVTAEQSPLKLWIDPLGRILKIRSITVSDGTMIVTVSEYLDPKYSAPPASEFDFNIPDGFMPLIPPKMVRPISTGDEAALGLLLEWPTDRSVDFQKERARKAMVVLFTSNDLVSETDEDWSGLAQTAQAKGVEFIQVWLGAKPPVQAKKWPVFWDKTGSNERSLGITSTPFAIRIQDGVVTNAWKGTAADAGKEAATALFAKGD